MKAPLIYRNQTRPRATEWQRKNVAECADSLLMAFARDETRSKVPYWTYVHDELRLLAGQPAMRGHKADGRSVLPAHPVEDCLPDAQSRTAALATAEALQSAFLWHRTPHGWAFWDEVRRRLQQLAGV